MILQSGGFGWDEAAHALRGLLIARDLAQGDWLSFLYDSYRQVYWPPVHSWLTGITFLVGGINTVAARTVSLVTFVMASWAIYVAGLLLRKQNAEMGAAIAAILFISCPSLISFAGKSMLEIPGLLALILSFVVHFKLIQARSSPPAYALLGLAVAATYFVKSNYGVLFCLALLISWSIDAKFRPRLLFTRTHIYTASANNHLFGMVCLSGKTGRNLDDYAEPAFRRSRALHCGRVALLSIRLLSFVRLRLDRWSIARVSSRRTEIQSG